MFPFVEFVAMFWMPLLFGASSIVGALAGLVLRDDAPRAEWPREEQ